jgi:hypothetical protein
MEAVMEVAEEIEFTVTGRHLTDRTLQPRQKRGKDEEARLYGRNGSQEFIDSVLKRERKNPVIVPRMKYKLVGIPGSRVLPYIRTYHHMREIGLARGLREVPLALAILVATQIIESVGLSFRHIAIMHEPVEDGSNRRASLLCVLYWDGERYVDVCNPLDYDTFKLENDSLFVFLKGLPKTRGPRKKRREQGRLLIEA